MGVICFGTNPPSDATLLLKMGEFVEKCGLSPDSRTRVDRWLLSLSDHEIDSLNAVMDMSSEYSDVILSVPTPLLPQMVDQFLDELFEHINN